MKSIADIRASVKYKWSHGNHKFTPGQRVIVNNYVLDKEYAWDGKKAHTYESYFPKCVKSKYGDFGNVLAVSCTKDGRTRGNGRQFTRYYVIFKDGSIHGIHSHALTSA